MNLIFIATKELADILGHVLPRVCNDWWDSLVWPAFTPVQQRRLSSMTSPGLGTLDLPALISVFERNREQLNSVLNLDWETMNYMKELRTIRNRIAHAGADATSCRHDFRCWETLHLLLERIGGSPRTITIIEEQLRSLLPSYFEDGGQ